MSSGGSGPDSIVGRRIAGRFVVEAPIGTGGMGRIFRARDEKSGAHVALKLLKRALLEDEVLRERFRREALSLAQLRHPGIVAVLDFGETDEGDLYTALELVSGGTLAALMEPGAMALARATPIFDQMLEALDVCHASGVVHRDVKPSNVMIATRDGLDRVKLIDFGLVRMEMAGNETLTETGAVQGTPLYMAPEQCRGEEIGPKTDVYACGVVFYEALAGVPPFQAKDAATFMAQHLFVDPPSLRTAAAHLPSGICGAVHHALAKRPDDRPTAAELRAALAAAIAGNDPEARAEAAANARNRGAGLTRTERMVDAAPRAVPYGTNEGAHARATVLVWMANDARSAALRSCLGTAAFACKLVGDDAADVDLDAVDALVLAMKDVERIARVRSRDPKLPIVVVDVASPEETTSAIRAGASDMLLAGAPDADLPPKIERLLRRRKRSR